MRFQTEKQKTKGAFYDLKITLLLIVFVLTFLFAISINLLYKERVSYEDKIRIAISKANYCDTAIDCQNVGSVCPFGCDIFVNKTEKENISAILGGYNGRCQYLCVELKDVQCVENKCVARYEP